MLDAVIELLRLLVPTMLLAVLRGGWMFAGVCMLRAGLYAGIGGFGMAAMRSVFRGIFGGGGGPGSVPGISLGPTGRHGEVALDGFELTYDKPGKNATEF